ncbi:MAG: hypothetical protein WBN36_03465 [Gammaproteobacteria bacterium]
MRTGRFKCVISDKMARSAHPAIGYILTTPALPVLAGREFNLHQDPRFFGFCRHIAPLSLPAGGFQAALDLATLAISTGLLIVPTLFVCF